MIQSPARTTGVYGPSDFALGDFAAAFFATLRAGFAFFFGADFFFAAMRQA
jgi:hypothetical protein